MFATKRAATRLKSDSSLKCELCAVRCMYNVDWSEGASPDFNKTRCAVEFSVNGTPTTRNVRRIFLDEGGPVVPTANPTLESFYGLNSDDAYGDPI
uniref:FMN-binding glutamate synthase family protein n=1 Tax=Bursaphelenchus xylophilus TaxID=6326 RepID=A0A1I7S0X2_BURXY